MSGISDRLFIGYDLSGDDMACLVIGRRIGRGYKIIKTFYGSEAEKLYEILSDAPASERKI